MSLPVTSEAECESRLADASSRLVVIDFHAEWCQPCTSMTPVFESLARQHTEVVFLRADVDECESLARHFGVKCVPTYVFVRDRKQVDAFSGANEFKLRELVIKLKKKKCNN